MHFSAFVLPLALALTAVAEPLEVREELPQGFSYAKQYRREATALNPRQLSLDPAMVCGDGYDDCDNGFCCTKGSTCAGTITKYNIAICNDPSQTTLEVLKGTAVATPYKDLIGVASSLGSVLQEITKDGIPTALPSSLFGSGFPTSIPTGSPTTGGTPGGASSSGPTSPQDTGAAAFNGPAGLWGAAAVAGAGILMVV